MDIPRPENPLLRDSCCSDDAPMGEEEPSRRSHGSWSVEIDSSGRMLIGPELSVAYGLRPGIRLHLEDRPDGLLVRRPVTQLARVYVEPTNRCNLACHTCLQSTSNEPRGEMTAETFDQLFEGIRPINPLPSVIFGGFGEPLLHPGISAMIGRVKRLGARAELITNATRLDAGMSRRLLDAGVDMVWFSLDGATPESYTGVRAGADFSQVIDNIERFRRLDGSATNASTGIVFVAMKSNVQELPALLRLADRLRVRQILVSNVIAYSEDLRGQSLFLGALTAGIRPPSRRARVVTLPRMDLGGLPPDTQAEIFHSGWNVKSPQGNTGDLQPRCPFVETGSLAVRHDGRISPCLALMHSHTCHVFPSSSRWQECIMGELGAKSLEEIWSSADYISFRSKVQAFDFAPCGSCAGCDLSSTNRDDCFGSGFPSCGACPWAQGFILCP